MTKDEQLAAQVERCTCNDNGARDPDNPCPWCRYIDELTVGWVASPGDVLVRNEETCGATNWQVGTCAEVVDLTKEELTVRVETLPSTELNHHVHCFANKGWRFASPTEAKLYRLRCSLRNQLRGAQGAVHEAERVVLAAAKGYDMESITDAVLDLERCERELEAVTRSCKEYGVEATS